MNDAPKDLFPPEDHEDDHSMVFGDDDEGGSSANENSMSFSSTGDSRKSGSTNCKVKKEIAHIEKYSESETAQVNRLRLFVILSILVVGAFVSVFSYVILQRDETQSIEDAVRHMKSGSMWTWARKPTKQIATHTHPLSCLVCGLFQYTR
jgi:hypothetical protein